VNITCRTLLAAAAELAQLAGERALTHYRRKIAVDLKADGSPVTSADREAEMFAREWLSTRFPGDSVLGEEFGAAGDATSQRRWVIDPVDGTRSFIKGVPLWGTLIAVMEGSEILAGAAAFPACNESIAAARGEGAWWNGARTRVSEVATMAEATVCATGTAFEPGDARRERWDALGDRAQAARTWGDAYGYMLVATGRAEVMMDPRLEIWDAAPLIVIVEEAGGVFTDWRGARTCEGHGAIATNAALADEVRKWLVASAK
jgi:histidinol phosphatase-like enzyme (inositol monophosphatase family)